MHERYPNRDDYICVAQAMLNKYPFFRPKDGNPYVSCKFLIVHLIHVAFYSN